MQLYQRLQALHPGASRRRLKQWLTASRVRVNGAIVRRGDVAVGVDDRVELNEPPPPACPPPLRLVHEDADVLVVDKPPGLLTIATERERERTAYRLLRDWVAARRIESARLFIVHRLDRETSGLIVFAKSAVAKERLQAQFAARAVERIYVALVEGVVRRAEGTLTSRLIEDRALRVRTTDGRVGREAITRYRVLERRRNTSPPSPPPSSGRRPTSRSPRSRRASSSRSRATTIPASPVTDWTVETLSRAIAARKISPVEATQACLGRIERLDGRLHAFITVDAEGALAAARALEAELAAGHSRGPLHGVPLAYKDLCHVSGLPTSCGTKTREYFPSSIECTAVTRLREAGAVTLGKLNMTELAMGPFGDNAHHGDVQNPWRPGHCAGG